MYGSQPVARLAWPCVRPVMGVGMYAYINCSGECSHGMRYSASCTLWANLSSPNHPPGDALLLLFAYLLAQRDSKLGDLG